MHVMLTRNSTTHPHPPLLYLPFPRQTLCTCLLLFGNLLLLCRVVNHFFSSLVFDFYWLCQFSPDCHYRSLLKLMATLTPPKKKKLNKGLCGNLWRCLLLHLCLGKLPVNPRQLSRAVTVNCVTRVSFVHFQFSATFWLTLGKSRQQQRLLLHSNTSYVNGKPNESAMNLIAAT